MSDDLPERLRALRALLQRLLTRGEHEVGDDGTAGRAERAADRMDRDLLPRTAGAHSHLVVGVVGPNNAGKSALFNSLCGSRVSPSVPTGGATRRLVGACHAALRAALEREPTLAGFPLRGVTPGPNGTTLAMEDGDPAELLLVELDDLPETVLLVDTPDFDSVRTENRLASESLLRVADLAVVVVTRHTYQNKEVVDFLESWLAHGRPWMLVYNESLGAELTAEHAKKLASDLGSDPLAVFHAPFDLEVTEGASALEPTALAGNGLAAGAPLRDWLLDLPQAAELKGRSLAASLAQLRDDLRSIASRLDEESERAGALLAVAREHAARVGGEVASRAMPMGPFLEAFRAVLDRRPGKFQRGFRGAIRGTRRAVEGLITRLPFVRKPSSGPSGAATGLADVERRALEPLWAPFYEELCIALDGGKSGVDPTAEEAAALAADLAPGGARFAFERAASDLASDPDVLREFQEACEELIEAELDAGGNEWVFQIAVDALHLLPAVAAGIVIVHTGGLGADVAVGGAGALSTLLAERLSKLLGTHVAHRARERWRRLRGARLADTLLRAALPGTAPLLERRANERAEISRELKRHLKEIPWEPMERTTT